MTAFHVGFFTDDPELENHASSLLQRLNDDRKPAALAIPLRPGRPAEARTIEDLDEATEDRRRTARDALYEGSVDLIVTRARDWPFDQPEHIVLDEVIDRAANPATWLIAARGLARPSPVDPIGLPRGACVAVSSVATARQLLARRPDLCIVAASDHQLRRRPADWHPNWHAAVCSDPPPPTLDEGLESTPLDFEAVLPATHGRSIVTIRRQRTGEPPSRCEDPPRRCVETERLFLSALPSGRRSTTECLAQVTPQNDLRLLVCHVRWTPNGPEASRFAAVAADASIACTTCLCCLEDLRKRTES